MSKRSELLNISRSFSHDRTIEMHHRSGDVEGDGKTLLDLITSTQSAEDDIIDEEEERERSEAKRKAVKVLKAYISQVYTPEEKRFLLALQKNPTATPARIGATQGVKWYEIGCEIRRKWQDSESKLKGAFRRVGYDYMRGLSFMPKLFKRLRLRDMALEWRANNPEKLEKYLIHLLRKERKFLAERVKEERNGLNNQLQRERLRYQNELEEERKKLQADFERETKQMQARWDEDVNELQNEWLERRAYWREKIYKATADGRSQLKEHDGASICKTLVYMLSAENVERTLQTFGVSFESEGYKQSFCRLAESLGGLAQSLEKFFD